MWGFLLRRLLVGIVTLGVAATVVFGFIHLIPGDPVMIILEDSFSQDAYDAVASRLGLDRPLHVQYFDFMASVVRGEWGTSFRTQRSVLGDLTANLPFTVHLALASMVIALVIGFPAGVVSALFRNRWPDRVGMFMALIGVCIPNFWLGVVLMLVFAFQLRMLPAIGVGDGSLIATLRHVALPAITLGTGVAAIVARMVRSSLLDTLGQDYIRTARSKGLGERGVVVGHAMRNALIPVVTVIGLEFGSLLSGTTIVEIVFSRPGIGKMLIEGLSARDYPQIQGTLLLYVLIIVLVNTVVDLIYTVIDPRIRMS